jgi:phosphatidylglycerophosphate synthase
LLVKLLGRLRARYEAAMQPIGRALGKIGLTPNAISTISLLIAVLAAVAYAYRAPVFGALGLLGSGVVDMLDGSVARATGAITRFGAVFDPVLDRYAEFAVLFGMGFGGLVSWVWVIFSLFGMVMASYVRARAESAGGLESCSVGIAERQEKIILLLIGSLIQPFFNLGLSISVVIVGILSHVTAAQRLRFTFTQTSGRNASV